MRRYNRAIAPFAASAEGTTKSYARLASLVPPGEHIYLQHAERIAPPAGFVLVRAEQTVQMVADRAGRDGPPMAVDELGPDDAHQMLALARLTKPGPFAERTFELGRFVGVRRHGDLIAMAGERMKAGSFTEVAAVCTHPDHRGLGYAAELLRVLACGILERGETPFLHAYAHNDKAIGVYLRLGFEIRWRPTLMLFERVL